MEERTGRAQCNGRYGTAGQLDQGSSEKVADANTKGCHGKTGHILIGSEIDRQEAVDQSHEQRSQKTGEKRDQNGEQRNNIRFVGNGLLVQEGTNDPTDAACIHHAGNTEIQIARFFRKRFTG